MDPEDVNERTESRFPGMPWTGFWFYKWEKDSIEIGMII